MCLFGDESLSLRDALRKPQVESSKTNGDSAKWHTEISGKSAYLHSLIEQTVYGKKAKLGGHDSIEELVNKSKDNRPMILIGG